MTLSGSITSVQKNGRSSIAAIAGIDDMREELHAEGRARLGVTGKDDTPPLRQTLREASVGLYTVVALGVLTVMDQLQGYAFTVMTPDMSRALGLSLGAIAGMRTLQALTHALSPLPFAWLTQTRPRRALLSIVTGVGWSMVAFGNGLVVNLWGLALVLAMDGILGGSVIALHNPLIMDSYPPAARVRLLSIWTAFRTSASIVAPLLITVCVSVLGLTWRGVFLMLGTVSMVGALFSLGLRDPGFGKWDTRRLQDTVHTAHGESSDQLSAEQVRLGFFEIIRRVLLIPTVRRLAFGYLALGILVVPYATFLSFFLDEEWGMDAGARGWFFAFTSVVAVAALVSYGRRGEALFRQNPGGVLQVAGGALAAAVVLIVLAALTPFFIGMVALFAVAQALVAILLPLLGIAQLSILRAEWRPHASALIGIFMAAGSLAGLLLLVGVEAEYGLNAAFVSLVVPGVIAALIIRSAKDLVDRDLDRMIDDVLEVEQIQRITSSNRHLPLLSCRKIDFSYGNLQVLFDVDFTVGEGEMVALLGTNGSGKSTLLKVISGIGLPTTGTVRYGGQDVTYLDAERRVRLGISQISGGRAVFGQMNVVENMRAFGYTLGRDRKAIEDAIDRSFEHFPRLHERRRSLASTLSGGEQQMLGLSKALILRPRILLIDELALGLAPVIVAHLLDMVKEINSRATAVVLVEQSVNIGLSVAHHAYFMEKGQIRFDGPGQDLLARGDLLRAVFLEGVSKGAQS